MIVVSAMKRTLSGSRLFCLLLLSSACSGNGETALADGALSDATAADARLEDLPKDGPHADGPDSRVSFFASALPQKPSEAFDLRAIKAALLSQLDWVKTDEAKINGVRMIEGTFSPGHYTGPRADGAGVETIVMKSRARVYFPATADGPLPILVHAAHLATNVDAYDVAHRAIVEQYAIAIVVHGQSTDDWVALGYPDDVDLRGRLTNEGLDYLIKNNRCAAVDLLTGNFGYALAKTNMLAQTLARRLLEAEGYALGSAAQYGGSKEGFATWVSAAVDDRLSVAAPSYYQRFDLQSLTMYENNSGCGPNGAHSAADVPALLTFRNWTQTTAAGAAAARVLLVSSFVADLHPAALIIYSDIGMHWMHDGRYFTLAADTHFLDNFDAKPFRHERFFEQTEGSATEPRRAFELGKVAQLLVADDPAAALSEWPRILSANADVNGTTVDVEVAVNDDPDIARVTIYFALSDDREYNDIDQSGWRAVALSRRTGGSNVWAGSFPLPGDGQLAWYAEVEELYTVGPLSMPRRHVSQIRFLRELPPLGCRPCEGQQTDGTCFVEVVCE